ncbi:MAG: hypothetical protein Q9196_003602 [Gyalolechia fulgens]
MAAQVAEYKNVLEDLRDRVGKADQLLIQRTLQNDITEEPEENVNPSTSPQNLPQDKLGSSGFYTEHQATGDAGSTDSVDHINEDFNRSGISRATGYLGKSSEATWMGTLMRRTSDGDFDDKEKNIPQMSFGFGLDPLREDGAKQAKKVRLLSDSCYHCDDVPFLCLDNVQAYQLPPRATADSLLTCYLESVHPVFPILGKTTFLKQFQAFYNNPNINTGPKWLSILNLIFALGARYSGLVRAEWRGIADEHDVYFSRAWLLGLDTDSMWTPADLQKIQIAGLASFYLMARQQINRAFTMSGIAVRQALSLGLHLRNEDPHLADFAKEIRNRVWWAVASTERTLSVMVGRPTCFVGSDCSAPLPLPLEEEMFMSTNQPYDAAAAQQARRLSAGDDDPPYTSASTPSSVSSRANLKDSPIPRSSHNRADRNMISPNNGLFFLYITKLKILDDNILKQLYRPDIKNKTWATVQNIMLSLQGRLDRWRSGLHAVFDFTRTQPDQSFSRQRMCLALMYYSTVIITKRPCLCKMEERVPNETKRGQDIDRASAAECVLAAQSLVDLLPDEINVAIMYQISPWWNMVHHLMQAATALMLELSFNAVHCPDAADVLFVTAQKAVAWLQSMAADDLAAARAWKLSSDALGKVASRIGRRIDDRLTRLVPTGEDVSMQDLLMPSPNYNAASSAYVPMISDEADYLSMQPQTTSSWEPLMFTSYDNYLSNNLSNTQLPPRQQQHQQYQQHQQHQQWE